MSKSPTNRGRPKANAADQKIGDEVRARRVLIGMTQGALGDALGVSFQQVQKYEKGANRISATRLHQIASSLDVAVSHFYGSADGDGVKGAVCDPVRAREDTELLRAFGRIEEPLVRQRVLNLIKSLAVSLRDGRR